MDARGSEATLSLGFSKNSISVPYYVIETLGLAISPQTNLMVVRPSRHHNDIMKIICRALRGYFRQRTVSDLKMCYVQETRDVYCLVKDPSDMLLIRKHQPYILGMPLGWSAVRNITLKEGSFESYINIPADCEGSTKESATIESITVSQFVPEYLGISAGVQTHLFLVRGLEGVGVHAVKLVTRIVRGLIGRQNMHSLKFAFDWSNGTVFVLVPTDYAAFLLKDANYSVDEHKFTMLQVSELLVIDASVDEYFSELP